MKGRGDKASLQRGDPAPMFHQRTTANPRYAFDTVAGRYILLCFFGSAADPRSQAALAAARSRPDFFDDDNACFFGVSTDPADQSEQRVKERYPGYRFFWDFDRKISSLYGAIIGEGEAAAIDRRWVLLDPTLHVVAVIPFEPDGSDIARTLARIDALPAPSHFAGFEVPAPVIVLPNVLEPELCERLIGLYETGGGQESGFMREIDGVTVGVSDRSHKSRRDHEIVDREVRLLLQERFQRRVTPEIQKVHQFRVTRMERYIVACYSEEDGGHFRAHRDNTTKGTAHRRFAVSVNLNDDFEGGEILFPEYGPRGFKPPPGGAVIFSCSLLHSVSRVTRGRRYAFLPFLYDEAAAKLREANAQFLEESRRGYRASGQA